MFLVKEASSSIEVAPRVDALYLGNVAIRQHHVISVHLHDIPSVASAL